MMGGVVVGARLGAIAGFAGAVVAGVFGLEGEGMVVVGERPGMLVGGVSSLPTREVTTGNVPRYCGITPSTDAM
jgi:hypothetical protein